MSRRGRHHDEETLSRVYDSRLMKRLLAYLKPYKWAVTAGLLLLLLIAALEISMTILIQIGIDDYIATKDLSGFRAIALIYLGVIVLVLVTSCAQLYLTMWLGQKVQHDIRSQLFEHLQSLPTAFFDRNPVGRLVTRVTSDVGTLNELFSSGVVTILSDLATLVFIIGALLYYNWQLALLTFVALPLLIAASFWFRARIRHQFREIRVRLARLNAFVQEHIVGIDVIHLFCREKRARDRFAGINRRVRTANLKSVYYSALFFPTVEIIGALSVAILLYAGGIRVLDSLLTFGELVAFINLVERFYQPIQSLSEEFGVLQSSMASSERIFQLLDTETAVPTALIATGTRPSGSDINYKNVWFAYEGDDWILRDVSLLIASGQKVAIVGATGAGKTSLISLLFRFYDYRRGSISIGGVPIDQMPLNKLRSRLGLVLQDGFVFGGTVAENIRLGRTDINDATITRAVQQVGLIDNAHTLPHGIDTTLQDGGPNLSSGQKQLLSLARVLVHDPEILVLDEATSSVDTHTEQLIEKGLDSALRGRTSLVIAHRLSTVRNADLIAVLHHGELRELGSHVELMEKGGIYNKLYRLQFDARGRAEKMS